MIMLSWITKIKLELMAYEAMFTTVSRFNSQITASMQVTVQTLGRISHPHRDLCTCSKGIKIVFSGEHDVIEFGNPSIPKLWKKTKQKTGSRHAVLCSLSTAMARQTCHRKISTPPVMCLGICKARNDVTNLNHDCIGRWHLMYRKIWTLIRG
jgi:hypothetical protein